MAPPRMPTRTREPCQPTRHQGGSSCFHRGSSPGGKTNRVLPVSTFVFFEDRRVLPYRAQMHPFPFLLSFFTFALPPNCPLFKTANNSSARRFFIRIGHGSAYIHICMTSIAFLAFPRYFTSFRFFEEEEKRMKIQSAAIVISLDFEISPRRKMKNEEERISLAND